MRRASALLWVLLAAALACAPAWAQDAGRGRRLYETHCGGCHYERVHQRGAQRSQVHSLAALRNEVARWSRVTAQRFTRDDLEDIVAYLNASHYHLAR